MQQLKAADQSHRRIYMEWVLEQQAIDDNLSKKFSSAMKCISPSRVMLINKIVVFDNPQLSEKRLLHPKQVRIWCIFWSEGGIGT